MNIPHNIVSPAEHCSRYENCCIHIQIHGRSIYSHSDRLRASLGLCKTIEKDEHYLEIDLDTNMRHAKTSIPLKSQSPKSLHNKDLNIAFSLMDLNRLPRKLNCFNFAFQVSHIVFSLT